jgi:simple sugar transport system permease protein
LGKISPAIFGAGIAVGMALLLTIGIIMASSPDPGKTLRAFFIGPWSSPWFIGNTLDGIALLLTASLGVLISFRGGCFNLGGEGQVYLGGLAASAALLAMKEGPALPGVCLAVGAAVLTGAFMGFVPGLLKRLSGASELITSFLLSAALSPAADYLIAGPLRGAGSNLLATDRFPPDRLLPRLLPPSNLSLSFVFALLLIPAGHLFINRTSAGYRFRIAASAPDFARYGGIAPERCWIPAMTISGALGGLAGFFAVAGTYGICHQGFSGGLGWNAIAVALIARNHPLALLPSGAVYGWLKAGSGSALLAAGLNFETAAFIQAAVMLFATVRFSVFPAGKRKRHA